MSSTALQRLVEPLEDFECWYDGAWLKIRAKCGQFFATDHEVVRKHPEKFGVARAIVLGSPRYSEAREQKTAKPQRPKPSAARTVAPAGPSLPVHMSVGPPITITRGALSTISEALRMWRGQVETGGGLIVNPEGARPVIIEATQVASDRERDSVSINLFSIWFDRQRRQKTATARLSLGQWHSHPGGTTEPSDARCQPWRPACHRA